MSEINSSIEARTDEPAAGGVGILVDFGLGNLAALRRKVAEIDPDVRVSASPEEIELARYLILPGVGHFARAMANLDRRGILPVLHCQVMQKKIPILGICVGMQLFARHSEEGDVPGLSWIDAEVRRFPAGPLKVPHVGWNLLTARRNDSILENVPDHQRFYFIHSYRVLCHDEKDVLAEAWYGDQFAAVIRKDNIVGVQFHPEKSHRAGLAIIANFLRKARS